MPGPGLTWFANCGLRPCVAALWLQVLGARGRDLGSTSGHEVTLAGSWAQGGPEALAFVAAAERDAAAAETLLEANHRSERAAVVERLLAATEKLGRTRRLLEGGAFAEREENSHDIGAFLKDLPLGLKSELQNLMNQLDLHGSKVTRWNQVFNSMRYPWWQGNNSCVLLDTPAPPAVLRAVLAALRQAMSDTTGRMIQKADTLGLAVLRRPRRSRSRSGANVEHPSE
jgi:hypothetical protein